MIQSEIIVGSSKEELVENLNYFLERLNEHQLYDVKVMNEENEYSVLILYRVE